MKNIILAVDFSDVSGKLVQTGIKIAKSFNAKVYLLHVEPPSTGYILYNYGGIDAGITGYFFDPAVIDGTFHKEIINNEQHALDSLKKEFIRHNLEVESVLIEGEIVKNIVDFSKKINSDLIIIGNHKHGNFFDFIMGDRGNSIISRSDCDVYVVETRKVNKNK